MYRLILIGLVCLFALSGTVSAQDDELQCEETELFAAIDEAIEQFEEARTQNARTALAFLVSIRAMLTELDAQCLGLTFSGTAETVHGPVYVPPGIYRVSVTTIRSFDMELAVLEGDCGDGRYIFLLGFYEGEFTAETIFESEGCSALFETDVYGGPYTVTFEKIR